MYNRAKRNFDVNLGSTPGCVGPGSYSCDSDLQTGNKNKAPFGSLSERKTLEYAEFQGVLGPGSGYYKVPSQFEHISGGKIPFQNGPRLVDPRPVDDNPPPGAYFKMPDWSSAALSKKVPKKHAKIGVVFKPAIDPPSIPTQGLAYGYEYLGPANIKRQPPPKRDDTLGPAFYSPKKSTMNGDVAAKWSKRSEKRDINQNPQFQLNNFTPGPQHYETTTNVDELETDLEEPRPLQTAPRFVEKKPDVPAATKYSLSRFGDKIQANAISSSFVSNSERFVFKSNGVPKPGSYDNKSELITKKSFRLDQAHTHAPFTSSSARFKSKKVQARMAHLGPATYDVNSQSIAVQSIRDAILKKTMKGGFGTNSKRSDGTLRSNTVDVLPGPGHYEIRTDMKTNKPSESAFGTSCFTSMSNRMQNSLKAQESVPSPWEYNIKNHSIESKCERLNKKRNLKKAFNGSITREKATKMMTKTGIDSPGPAAYSVNPTTAENVYISQGKRFTETLNDAPHPQTYSLIDDRFGALEKTGKTFNATLGNATLNSKKKNVKTPRPTQLDKTSLLVSTKC
jgi:hypothetical protein